MRKAFAYGGAAAMTPYLLIKISWVLLAPDNKLLNLVTVGMSAAGITLALALARPWGMRVPGWAVLSFAWIAGGFLVPMVPYMLVSTALSNGSSWEGWLIELSFIGMGVCLAVALPLYLRERWPAAFRPGARRPAAALLAVAFAGISAYWVLGGTAGIAHPEGRDLNWHLLLANDALWALAAAAGAWWRGPAALVWIGSGFLFAWNAWKLPLGLLFGAEAGWPEAIPAASVRFVLGIAAGALMLAPLVGNRDTTAPQLLRTRGRAPM
ncbi:hypothetical protein [Dactylosporangium sp. CS-033363]|uniref:hypothetical protein n=1 Tax=Dactylosporangium sp. CS-033363 TaxID=3239935 RepID=UPI003D8E7C72